MFLTRSSAACVVFSAALAAGPLGASELVGPALLPPGGATLTTVGSSAADPGGVTVTFSNLEGSASSPLAYGPSMISVELQDGPHELRFDPAASALPGLARYTATVLWEDPDHQGAELVPLRVSFSLAAPSVGTSIVATDQGSGAWVEMSGAEAEVRLAFEAEYPRGSGAWIPFNALRQAQRNGGKAFSSAELGFFWDAAEASDARVTDLGGLVGSARLTAAFSGNAAAVSITGARSRSLCILSVTASAAGTLEGVLAGFSAASFCVIETDIAGNVLPRTLAIPAGVEVVVRGFLSDASVRGGAAITNAVRIRK